ncbi:MAG: CZB domain-containing protein [Sulfuricella sp.]|nr:CZB domain-containing protein [Sulfuricella sp.]
MSVVNNMYVSLDKDEAQRMLRKAKSAHIKWRSYAQGLVAGLDIAEDKAPVQHTDCSFGKWYYGMGQQALGHHELYEGIEVPHRILHQIYGEIYHYIEKGKADKAKERLPHLVEISRTLLEAIALLEQEINAPG